MSWSLGEAKALTIKAARGAGRPWGMAEEAGMAVHWLQMHGAPGVAAMADYLEWIDAAPADAHDLCPIALGTAIMDARCRVPEQLGRLRQPLLIAPFLAACMPSGIKLTWDGVELVISENGLVTGASRGGLLTEEATCRTEPATSCAAETTLRVPGQDGDSIARLGSFAARIYAPATEASRTSGAGSGLSDND